MAPRLPLDVIRVLAVSRPCHLPAVVELVALLQDPDHDTAPVRVVRLSDGTYRLLDSLPAYVAYLIAGRVDIPVMDT